MANTVFRCLIPLTLIAMAGCSRGPVPNVSVVEVTPSSRSDVSVVGSMEVSGQQDLVAKR